MVAGVNVVVGTIYFSSLLWGIYSINTVFGTADCARILAPMYDRPRPTTSLLSPEPLAAVRQILSRYLDRVRHWRLWIGIPLIPSVLVLARTTLADAVLPVLPIVFFGTQVHASGERLDEWPPSASLCFALLPYARAGYNAYYQRVWAAREARWLAAIKPRASETNEEDAANGDAEEAMNEDAPNVIEVRIDHQVWEEWEEDPAVLQQQAQQQQQQPAAPPLAQPPQQEDEQADPPPNIPDGRQQAPPPRPAAAAAPADNNIEHRVTLSVLSVAHTLVGALLFPAISSLSGELLRLLLPLSWTTPPRIRNGMFGSRVVGARGLLQEKWARSLVGGCAFVVLKDAVGLYVRWRMAEMHKGRKVLEYEGKRARGM